MDRSVEETGTNGANEALAKRRAEQIATADGIVETWMLRYYLDHNTIEEISVSPLYQALTRLNEEGDADGLRILIAKTPPTQMEAALNTYVDSIVPKLPPIYYSAYKGHDLCVELMLRAGSPTNDPTAALFSELDTEVASLYTCGTPLSVAVEQGAENVVKLLGGDEAQQKRAGLIGQLWNHCFHRDLEQLRSVLLDPSVTIDMVNTLYLLDHPGKNYSKKTSLLHFAINSDNPALLKILLDFGADVNFDSDKYYNIQYGSPLFFACGMGNGFCVKMLQDRGAKLRGQCGKIADDESKGEELRGEILAYLVTRGHVRVVRMLEGDACAVVRAQEAGGVFDACRHGDVAELRSLLCGEGESAAKFLSQANSPGLEIQNGRRPTAASLAAGVGSLECLKLLEEIAHVSLFEIREPQNDHFTPLHYAIAAVASEGWREEREEGGRGIECVKYLLQRGLNPNGSTTQSNHCKSPLQMACIIRSHEVVKLLIDAGADVNLQGSETNRPLHEAALRGSLSCVKLLVESGAVVDQSNLVFSAHTPLHLAAMHNHAAVAKFLVERGASVNRKLTSETKIGIERSALTLAVYYHSHDCVKMMRDFADMFHAAQFGWVDRLETLIRDEGADVNAGDIKGRTAAYLAATHPIDVDVVAGQQNVEGKKENPCLDLLIHEYHATFLTKSQALLTEREKLARAFEFLVLGTALGVGFYAYLFWSSAAAASNTCDEVFGMLLQPYLYDFVTIFVFKAVQFLVEETVVPFADFASFLFFSFFGSGGGISKRVVPARPPSLSDKSSDVEDALPWPSKKPSAFSALTLGWKTRALYALVGDAAVKTWRKQHYLSAYKSDPEYLGQDGWKQTTYIFLYLQYATALSSFLSAAANVHGSTPWEMYTNFFAIIVNSGVPTALASHFKLRYIDGRLRQVRSISPVLYGERFLLLLVAAPVLTHIIVGVVMYVWVFTLVTIVPLVMPLVFRVLIMKIRDRHSTSMSQRSNFNKYHHALYLEVVCRMICIFLFQTSFNYAALLYQQSLPITPQTYLDVVRTDLHLRSQTLCFAERAFQSNKGLILFFSFF